MNKKALFFTLFSMTILGIWSCNNSEPTPVGDTYTFSPDEPDLQNAVQTVLIEMNDNDIIHFTAGTFMFSNTLSIDDKNNITIEGEGRDNTILDFSLQSSGGNGAQGIQASATNQILFKDFTIQDADGDNIKVKDSDGVSMINLAAIYTGTVGPDNGAYSLYPVTSKNVYIHNCFIRGASDAGIYVGQSQNVIVSNNEVTENVAGIEIENCISADVFENNVYDNTGGILIFDLPGLPIIENGELTRLYDNIITNNNHDNFAPQGNIVGIVPPGTGLMLLACRKVEVFNNEFKDNNLLPLSMLSYTIIGLMGEELNLPETYNPNVHIINIHDNTFTQVTNSYNPNQTDFGFGLIEGYQSHPDLNLLSDLPDVVWDGLIGINITESLTHDICVTSNADARFVNLKVSTNFILLNDDITEHDCTQASLPAVTVNARK